MSKVKKEAKKEIKDLKTEKEKNKKKEYEA